MTSYWPVVHLSVYKIIGYEDNADVLLFPDCVFLFHCHFNIDIDISFRILFFKLSVFLRFFLLPIPQTP